MTETRLRTRVKAAPTISFTPVCGGLLQHKCTCGGTPGPTGECEQCRKKNLQRKTRNSELGTRNDSPLPPIVPEVLRSSGQPLDAGTRDFMESRFGCDFSRVRLHTDACAAESTRSVSALAYTVGSHVVFAPGQYQPATAAGQRLLAHELAHVVQQSTRSRSAGSELAISKDLSLEREAEAVAAQVGSEKNVSIHARSLELGLQRQPAGPGKSPQDDDCSGWEQDPVSFSTYVAKYIAKMQIPPNVDVLAKSVACKDARHCDVTLSNGVVMRVAWEPSTRITLGRWESKDVVLRSIYTYSCRSGQLILTFKDFTRGSQ
jgi:Domain of unknown function (DUF4157)